MSHGWTYWHNLIDSERSIYMEFYSPVINNIKVMPENDDIVRDLMVVPTVSQLDRVLNDPENTVNNHFTDGQRNSILYWIEQHPDYMQSYYDDMVYNLDDNIVDIVDNIVNIEPYIELEDSSSDDESDDESDDDSSSDDESDDESDDDSDDDLEITSDSSDEEDYGQEN